MSFPHEVIAAYPTGGNPDPGLIRDMCTRRFAYALASSEAASDFVAKDPVSAIAPLYLIQNGTLYAYDATDSVTAPSAVCLVTSDACRYKSGTIEPPYSVLTYSTTAQPADGDVSDGDTFLLPIGATGADWAGKAGQIAMRVGAKWHFAISPIGRELYVQDADRKYYRNASGVWTAGNGSLAHADSSIPLTAVIGAKASFVVKVENQTTNAPPASPVAPVAYIIGPSPTGAWAGLAGQLAACLGDGSYTYIVPATGDEVFDKALGINVKFNGSAWSSATGAVVGFAGPIITLAQTTGTASGSVDYGAFDPAVAPTTTNKNRADPVTISYAAKRSGAWLRIRYSAAASFAIPLDVSSMAGALFRDAVSTAVTWRQIAVNHSITNNIDIEFWVQAPDTSLHTYKFSGVAYNNANAVTAYSNRIFTVEEFA